MRTYFDIPEGTRVKALNELLYIVEHYIENGHVMPLQKTRLKPIFEDGSERYEFHNSGRLSCESSEHLTIIA